MAWFIVVACGAFALIAVDNMTMRRAIEIPHLLMIAVFGSTAVLTWRHGIRNSRDRAAITPVTEGERAPRGLIVHRLRDQYGSRAWFWVSFTLCTAAIAFSSHSQGGANVGQICRTWAGCLFVVPLGGFLLSGSALALSLLLFGWVRRTRRLVYAGGLVITVLVPMVIIVAASCA
jgi:hypothetical protein